MAMMKEKQKQKKKEEEAKASWKRKLSTKQENKHLDDSTDYLQPWMSCCFGLFEDDLINGKPLEEWLATSDSQLYVCHVYMFN